LNKCKLSATTKRINVKTAVCLRQVASSESDDLEGQHKIGRSPLLMMMTALKARRKTRREEQTSISATGTAKCCHSFFYCSVLLLLSYCHYYDIAMTYYNQKF